MENNCINSSQSVTKKQALSKKQRIERVKKLIFNFLIPKCDELFLHNFYNQSDIQIICYYTKSGFEYYSNAIGYEKLSYLGTSSSYTCDDFKLASSINSNEMAKINISIIQKDNAFFFTKHYSCHETSTLFNKKAKEFIDIHLNKQMDSCYALNESHSVDITLNIMHDYGHLEYKGVFLGEVFVPNTIIPNILSLINDGYANKDEEYVTKAVHDKSANLITFTRTYTK